MFESERDAHKTIRRHAQGHMFWKSEMPEDLFARFLEDFESGTDQSEIQNALNAAVLQSITEATEAEFKEHDVDVTSSFVASLISRTALERAYAQFATVAATPCTGSSHSAYLQLVLYAVHECESARRHNDPSPMPKSLAVDIALSRGLGLDLFHVQTAVTAAKGTLLARPGSGRPMTAMLDVWQVFRDRANAVWPSHLAAVEACNAKARP